MAVDFTKHDARWRKDIALGFGEKISKTRPWSWECIVCKAHGPHFASSVAAIASATQHNGGQYNSG
jgi:hypothetical protein